mgnify:CR=1 FL=1
MGVGDGNATVEPADPGTASPVAAAMRRTTRTGEVVGPDQAPTVHEALRAHTLLAAHAVHSDATRGPSRPARPRIAWSGR